MIFWYICIILLILIVRHNSHISLRSSLISCTIMAERSSGTRSDRSFTKKPNKFHTIENAMPFPPSSCSLAAWRNYTTLPYFSSRLYWFFRDLKESL